MEFAFEIPHGFELLSKEHFRFEPTEEIFHDTVIQAISFSRHALGDPVIRKHLLKFSHLVLPSLIRMQQRSRIPWKNGKQPLHHCPCLSKVWTLTDRICQNFRVEQIQYRRKINFLIAHVELGNIRHQFFKWSPGLKIPIQQVVCDFADASFIRTVLISSLLALQAHIPHQRLNRFVVESTTGASQDGMHSSIAISTFILIKDFLDLNSN